MAKKPAKDESDEADAEAPAAAEGEEGAKKPSGLKRFLSIKFIGMVIVIVWVFVDAFLIPGWVRRQNNLLAAELGA